MNYLDNSMAWTAITIKLLEKIELLKKENSKLKEKIKMGYYLDFYTIPKEKEINIENSIEDIYSFKTLRWELAELICENNDIAKKQIEEDDEIFIELTKEDIKNYKEKFKSMVFNIIKNEEDIDSDMRQTDKLDTYFTLVAISKLFDFEKYKLAIRYI